MKIISEYSNRIVMAQTGMGNVSSVISTIFHHSRGIVT